MTDRQRVIDRVEEALQAYDAAPKDTEWAIHETALLLRDALVLLRSQAEEIARLTDDLELERLLPDRLLLEAEIVEYRTRVTAAEARADAAEAKLPVARFTVSPPAWGGFKVETTHPCLHTQVKPCKEIYPGDKDQWCGYCVGTHLAVPLPEPPDAARKETP